MKTVVPKTAFPPRRVGGGLARAERGEGRTKRGMGRGTAVAWEGLQGLGGGVENLDGLDGQLDSLLLLGGRVGPWAASRRSPGWSESGWGSCLGFRECGEP